MSFTQHTTSITTKATRAFAATTVAVAAGLLVAAAPVGATGVPTTKEQCMNGGWQQFGFKNQGQCVSFVVSHQHGHGYGYGGNGGGSNNNNSSNVAVNIVNSVGTTVNLAVHYIVNIFH